MMFKPQQQLLIFRSIGGFYRTLSANVKIDEDPARPKRKYVKKIATEAKKRSKELAAYFDTPERKHILSSYPEPMLRRKSKVPEGLYNTSESVARTIVDHLKKDLPPDKPLCELFPGRGHITKLLIEETKNQLLLYEPEEKFHKHLSDLIGAFPKRNVVLKNLDLTSLWKMYYVDKLDQGTRIDEALRDLNKKDYDDDTNIRMFVSTCSLPFIKHLINSMIFQTSLTSHGRCEFFMCLPPPLYIHLTCRKDAGYMMYRASSVLFQLLFEYEFICKLERKDFLPWQATVKAGQQAKIQKYAKLDPNSIYLVKIVARRNLFQHILPDNLVAFWFFVKQHFNSRKNRVIPTMERWIPNCGPRLIVNAKAREQPRLINPNLDLSTLPALCHPCYELTNADFADDVNIFTEFGDLTPTQVLTLFDQFINWPEFRECSFNASLESAMMKYHTNPDDVVDSRDLVEEVEEEEKEKPK